MSWRTVAYAVACVVVPIVWGVVVVRTSTWAEHLLQRRRRAAPPAEEVAFPPIDYHI